MKALLQRFRLEPFPNRSGTTSFCVSGTRRDGKRIRENYQDAREAKLRFTELETEYQAGHQITNLKTTRLDDTQIPIAEAAFQRLEKPADLTTAIDFWLRHGKPSAVAESPRLDEALAQFTKYLEDSNEYRDSSKNALRYYVLRFVAQTENIRVCDVTPEHIEKHLANMNIQPGTKNDVRKKLSVFFQWCRKRQRKWCVINPADFEIEGRANQDEWEPQVLTVAECKRLLATAETFEDGRLAPYTALALFAGIRPHEIQRLTWDAINLVDNEITVTAAQSKTGRKRTITIDEPLKSWLTAYQSEGFIDFKGFKELKMQAGFKTWIHDGMRHTSVSHYFRLTGSYGKTAERHGNSEKIIKDHYQGKVTSEQTKQFYGLFPTRHGHGEKIVKLETQAA